MKKYITVLLVTLIFTLFGCEPNSKRSDLTAAEILGNPDYLAISYGGYREITRDVQPTIEDLKEDMKLLAAMNIKIVRTYNTKLKQASNLLEAINQLRKEDPDFEMYVMLGAWINCENAWTDKTPNHDVEDVVGNTAEIERAVAMANQYPEIVKVIAVGNEAMVKWAASYFVQASVILKWVNHLQDLKKTGGLPKDLWITSSDNFASWGGAESIYHTDDLKDLINAVDYVSLHTYPFHDSHYNPAFWGVPENHEELSSLEKIDAAMLSAKDHAITQYQSVANYISSLGIDKPIHIGETGWASVSNGLYGNDGSKAADEYKQGRYYQHMREWTITAGISCFYFEAFDEIWKDASSPLGSENHFGLFTIDGQAKHALWDMVDEGRFKGLTRNGNTISKTYQGNKDLLMADVLAPPSMREIGFLETSNINNERQAGEVVTEHNYIIIHDKYIPNNDNNMTYPSAQLKLNAWDGTSKIKMSSDGIIEVTTGTGEWWGCGAEIQSKGEDLSAFENGYLHFDIKGETTSFFNVGFQTGIFNNGTQVNNFVTFGPDEPYSITKDWASFAIPLNELNKGADLKDVTGIMYFMGDKNFDGKSFEIKNMFYSRE